METVVLVPIALDKFEELITTCVNKAIESQKAKENPRLYSLQETAKILKVSMPTMIKYKKEKKLPFKQEGRKIWFSEGDIQAFIKQTPSFKYTRKNNFPQ